MPCSGPRTWPAARSRSRSSASARAFGFTSINGVKFVLVHADAGKILNYQLARGNPTLFHRCSHLGDGCLDHVERGRLFDGAGRLCFVFFVRAQSAIGYRDERTREEGEPDNGSSHVIVKESLLSLERESQCKLYLP